MRVTVLMTQKVCVLVKGPKMTGKMDKAKGHAKQAVGDLTGSKKLTAEGKIDVAAGKAKEMVEKTSKVVEGTSKKIKEIRK